MSRLKKILKEILHTAVVFAILYAGYLLVRYYQR